MKVCTSCAGREADGATFPRKRPGRPVRRTDCATAAASPPRPKPTTLPRTRASYRAAHRRRQQSPQTDLVDLLVPAP